MCEVTTNILVEREKRGSISFTCDNVKQHPFLAAKLVGELFVITSTMLNENNFFCIAQVLCLNKYGMVGSD